jgi:ssDNA-binding Zn-finger/Zn-ribbon topoisomerase 1
MQQQQHVLTDQQQGAASGVPDVDRSSSSSRNPTSSTSSHSQHDLEQQQQQGGDAAAEPEDLRKCPQCGGRLSLKPARGMGGFIGCSNYSTTGCQFAISLINDPGALNAAASTGSTDTDDPDASDAAAAADPMEKLLGQDPETGSPVLLKKGPYGLYVQKVGQAVVGGMTMSSFTGDHKLLQACPAGKPKGCCEHPPCKLAAVQHASVLGVTPSKCYCQHHHIQARQLFPACTPCTCVMTYTFKIHVLGAGWWRVGCTRAPHCCDTGSCESFGPGGGADSAGTPSRAGVTPHGRRARDGRQWQVGGTWCCLEQRCFSRGFDIGEWWVVCSCRCM